MNHPKKLMKWLIACSFAIVPLAPRAASANWFDIFGYDARASAMGAYTAVATDPTSTYYNPGGLGFLDGFRVQMGYAYARPWLRYSLQPATPGGTIVQSLSPEDRATDFTRAARPGDPQGQTIGVSTPLGFTGSFGRKVGFGIGIFVPLPSIVKIRLHGEELPYWLDYDTIPYTITILPGVAYQLHKTLSIGVGASLLADLPGNIGVGTTPIGNITNNGSIDIVPKVAPQAGVMWRPTDNFSVGFAYRGEVYVNASIDAAAVVDPQSLVNRLLPGLNVPVTGWLDPSVRNLVAPYVDGITRGVDVHLETSDLYSPAQYALGASWKPVHSLLLSGDVTLAKWSGYIPPFASTDLYFHDPSLEKLAETAGITHAGYTDAGFRDIVIPRIGFELTPLPFLALRGGYAYRPTPVPQQTLVSNIEDGDTHILSGGIGFLYVFPKEISPATVQVDFYAQYRMMAQQSNVKSTDPTVYKAYYLKQYPQYLVDDPGYPGYTAKGTAVSLGATLTVTYPSL